MLAGGTGCSQPHAIEQARNDFKLYMTKLLEHSAALETLRPSARHSRGEHAEISPAWGPAVGLPEDGGGSTGWRRMSPPAGMVDMTPFSPSYFREKTAWPRAGAVTPPRPRPPPNFSWMAERRKPQTRTAEAGEGSSCGVGTVSSPAGRAAEGTSMFAPIHVDRPWDELEDIDDEDGGWKAAWARRFARGPIHSEYQDSYPWPPNAYYEGDDDGVGDRARDVKRHSASHVRHPLPTAQNAWRSPAMWDGEVASASRIEDKHSSVASPAAVPQRRKLRRSLGVYRGGPASPAPHGKHTGDVKTDYRQASGTEGFAARAALGRSSREGEGEEEGQEEEAGSESEEEKPRAKLRSTTLPSSPPAEQTMRWETIDRSEGTGAIEAREGGEEEVAWQSRAAQAGSTLRAISSADHAGEDDIWMEGEDDVGRGEVAMMSTAPTLQYSPHKSIVTEYMDEFAWPAELPVPGRRGKRSGMGMDHVGRLLAGKRAEKPDRTPDPRLIARLGNAADRALTGGTPGFLAEMCRLKSPSAAARRLVLGLVVALGLRWRRWSDIRTQLLGNKPELLGFLRRFNKDRAGLTSAALRPFVEDPDLTPAQVRKVAASMVWLARWLRALHDYLAVRDAKLDTIPLSRRPHASLGGLTTTAPYDSQDRARGTVRGKARGTLPVTARGASRAGRVRGRPSARAKEEEEADTSAAALARVDLTPADTVGAIAATTASEGKASSVLKPSLTTATRRSHNVTKGGAGQARGRRPRESLQAASMRARASSCPPSSTTAAGDVTSGESRVRRRRMGGGVAGVVSFAGSAGSSSDDLESESAWTAGTVTSRGDVLEAPTEDQVDMGSTIVADENARPRDRYQISGVDGAISRENSSKEFSQVGRRSVLQRQQGAGKAMKGNSTQGGGGLLSRRAHASQACIYRHAQKGKTASHFANPKARRIVHERTDPILANTRWPPSVDVREREKTEQRSAFSLEHSVLATGVE